MFNTWGALNSAFDNIGAPPSQMSFNPSYDSNGYMNPWQIPQYTDPYSSLLSQGQGMMNMDSTAAAGMMNQGQGMLASQGATMQNYEGASSPSQSYPSYPNGAKAGSQTAGQMPQIGLPQQASPGMIGGGNQGNGSMMSPTQPTNGFNPWSLQGEAMSRVR